MSTPTAEETREPIRILEEAKQRQVTYIQTVADAAELAVTQVENIRDWIEQSPRPVTAAEAFVSVLVDAAVAVLPAGAVAKFAISGIANRLLRPRAALFGLSSKQTTTGVIAKLWSNLLEKGRITTGLPRGTVPVDVLFTDFAKRVADGTGSIASKLVDGKFQSALQALTKPQFGEPSTAGHQDTATVSFLDSIQQWASEQRAATAFTFETLKENVRSGTISIKKATALVNRLKRDDLTRLPTSAEGISRGSTASRIELRTVKLQLTRHFEAVIWTQLYPLHECEFIVSRVEKPGVRVIQKRDGKKIEPRLVKYFLKRFLLPDRTKPITFWERAEELTEPQQTTLKRAQKDRIIKRVPPVSDQSIGGQRTILEQFKQYFESIAKGMTSPASVIGPTDKPRRAVVSTPGKSLLPKDGDLKGRTPPVPGL